MTEAFSAAGIRSRNSVDQSVVARRCRRAFVSAGVSVAGTGNWLNAGVCGSERLHRINPIGTAKALGGCTSIDQARVMQITAQSASANPPDSSATSDVVQIGTFRSIPRQCVVFNPRTICPCGGRVRLFASALIPLKGHPKVARAAGDADWEVLGQRKAADWPGVGSALSDGQ